MTDLSTSLASFDIELEKLDLSDGDVVVWRAPEGVDRETTLRTANYVKDRLDRNHQNITVLVVIGDSDLSRLNEDDMALLGWVRPPRREPSPDKKAADAVNA